MLSTLLHGLAGSAGFAVLLGLATLRFGGGAQRAASHDIGLD